MSDGTGDDDAVGQSVTVTPHTAEAIWTANPVRAVTHGRFDDGTEKITVGDQTFRSTSVSIGEDEKQEFHGEPARNEQDVLQVCRTLRSVLNAQGATWSRFREAPGPTSDVDAIAEDESGGPPLQVQVTRVERGAWVILAREGTAILNLSTEALADGIRDAVRSKPYPSDQRAQLLLALDAGRSPAYVREAVVAVFRAKHQDWVEGLGYRAVWLVGPTDPMTFRLDRPD